MAKQRKVWGKRIVLRAGSWLRSGPELSAALSHRVHRPVEFTGEWGSFGYAIPLGGRVEYASDSAVISIDDMPRGKAVTQDQADEHNTELVTCRHCGAWLEDDSDGYGTQHGHCGCQTTDQEERQ